jgi:hypothetical protein
MAKKDVLRLFLYKNEHKEDGDSKPDRTGTGFLSRGALQKFVEAMQASDSGEIKVRAAGWINTNDSGKAYLSLQVETEDPKYPIGGGGGNRAPVDDDDVPF